MALLQLERNGAALFRAHGLVRSKVLDTADIVRDGDLSPTAGLARFLRPGGVTPPTSFPRQACGFCAHDPRVVEQILERHSDL